MFDRATTTGYRADQEIERGNGQPAPTFHFKNSPEKRVQGYRQNETSQNLGRKYPCAELARRFQVRLHCRSTIHSAPLDEVCRHACDHVGGDVNDDRS